MQQLCPWEAATYFVYSSNIPTLFFYSHIPAIITALIIGLLVFYKSDKSKIGVSLFCVTILFSLWSIFDLVIWATNRPDIVLFFWSLQILVEPLVYLLCFYLVYVFVAKKDLAFRWKLLGIGLYAPVVVLLSTQYNLIGVDVGFCNAIEGFIAQYFTYIIEIIFIILIWIVVDKEYKQTSDRSRQREILIFGLGVVAFLLAFSWGNLIGSFTENWNLAQAGLIGMPIFIGFLAYLIVRFHTFNVRLFGAQALVWGLIILIGSQFFFIRSTTNRILNAITFITVLVFGYFLIRSVKKEIQQKEELEGLTIDLQKVIEQRESLVHLVTHKVKGSFTRSKYIFAGLLDGTFGEISPEIKKYAEQGLESDNTGIATVDLVLNADNLQKGIIKYDMHPLDFKIMVEKIIAEKRVPAEAKGLALEVDIKEGAYAVLGDSTWLKEAINNLVENSIRYTKEGSIKIWLEDGNGKVKFTIKDTGIGIDAEDKINLFTQGGRGRNSVKVNVDSTGYGLYSVKLIIEAHKGKVWGESEGANKGSTFYVELDSIAENSDIKS